MGEYAIRKSDGQRIKIGTCADLFYLRFEDRNQVSHLSGNVDPASDIEATELRFRLPFPDEDDTQPGDYDPYNRGLRLYRMVKDGTPRPPYCEDFTDESTVEDPGTIQLHHRDSGLLLNVPCYHGLKLPEVNENMRALWSGKGHAFELSSLRPVNVDGTLQVRTVVRCRHCDHAWRYEWTQVWEFIPSDMQVRLRKYKEAAEFRTATARG